MKKYKEREREKIVKGQKNKQEQRLQSNSSVFHTQQLPIEVCFFFVITLAMKE